MLSPKILHPHPYLQANVWLLNDLYALNKNLTSGVLMDWALYQCKSQELAGTIDMENYAQMADFDFSSFSLIHLESKGNVFICSRSFLTKPNLKSWRFIPVADENFIGHLILFGGTYPCSIHRRVPPASPWSESKLVINKTYKSTKSPAVKTFVSIFKNYKICM